MSPLPKTWTVPTPPTENPTEPGYLVRRLIEEATPGPCGHVDCEPEFCHQIYSGEVLTEHRGLSGKVLALQQERTALQQENIALQQRATLDLRRIEAARKRIDRASADIRSLPLYSARTIDSEAVMKLLSELLGLLS